MIVRVALVSVALAGVSASAMAAGGSRRAGADAQGPFVSTGKVIYMRSPRAKADPGDDVVITRSDAAGAPSGRSRRARQRAATPAQAAALPPARPDPVDAAAPVASPAMPAVEAVAILPPLRPAAPRFAAVSGDDAALMPLASQPVSGARFTVVSALPPARPGFVADGALAVSPTAPPAGPAPLGSLFGTTVVPAAAPGPALFGRAALTPLISQHARLNGVPEDLVHRVVIRESKYDPRAIGRGGAMGLMQIKTATARGLGYTGGPAGLLDAETNLTYAVKYLAGAYKVAGGNYDQAVMHYARGYYYAAKRQGLTRGLYAPPAQAEQVVSLPQPSEPRPSARALFANAPALERSGENR